MNETDIKWNDFKMNVELHRSYIEVAIKLNMFYYAITGAILSFYFTNSDIPDAKYALILPLLFSAGLTIFFFWAAKTALVMRDHIRTTAEELQLKAYPEGLVLVFLCTIFSLVLAFVTVALCWYLLCH